MASGPWASHAPSPRSSQISDTGRRTHQLRTSLFDRKEGVQKYKKQHHKSTFSFWHCPLGTHHAESATTPGCWDSDRPVGHARYQRGPLIKAFNEGRWRPVSPSRCSHLVIKSKSHPTCLADPHTGQGTLTISHCSLGLLIGYKKSTAPLIRRNASHSLIAIRRLPLPLHVILPLAPLILG